jgi:hypothetical protein
MQPRTQLVNLAINDRLIENTQRMKQSPMRYVLGVLQDAANEDIDPDAIQAYDTLIEKNSPQALRSPVIGQYNDGMDDC